MNDELNPEQQEQYLELVAYDEIMRRGFEACARLLEERIREENSPAEIERLGKLFGAAPRE